MSLVLIGLDFGNDYYGSNGKKKICVLKYGWMLVYFVMSYK